MWHQVRTDALRRDRWACQASEEGRRAQIPCWGALDPHHTIKRSQKPGAWLEVDLVITLCRRHHDWTDGLLGEQAGRLMTTALGGGRFRVEVTHLSKWERREQLVDRA